jgi:hypothetical protein
MSVDLDSIVAIDVHRLIRDHGAGLKFDRTSATGSLARTTDDRPDRGSRTSAEADFSDDVRPLILRRTRRACSDCTDSCVAPSCSAPRARLPNDQDHVRGAP